MKNSIVACQLAWLLLLSSAVGAVELVPWPDNDRVPLTPPPGEFYWTLQWGNSSRLDSAQQTVIKSEADLRSVWSQVDQSGSAAPNIDFDQDMILLVAAGRNAAVRSIFVTGIDRLPDRWVAHYTEILVPAFCQERGVASRSGAFHLARTTRTHLKVEFQKHTRHMTCAVPPPWPRPPLPPRPPHPPRPPFPRPWPQPIPIE